MISVSALSVSPQNTGLGKLTSLKPRLATVVPCVVSSTVMPTSSACEGARRNQDC